MDAIRQELRLRDYVPVLCDFERPSNLSTMETVSTLAGMARFVIADLTDAKSVLQKLRDIVPSRPSLPVQPILLSAQAKLEMFDYFRMFPWVLETRYYRTAGRAAGDSERARDRTRRAQGSRTDRFADTGATNITSLRPEAA